MGTKKRNWKQEFAEAAGTTVSGIKRTLGVGLDLIDEKVIKPLRRELAEAKKETKEAQKKSKSKK